MHGRDERHVVWAAPVVRGQYVPPLQGETFHVKRKNSWHTEARMANHHRVMTVTPNSGLRRVGGPPDRAANPQFAVSQMLSAISAS